MWTVHVLLLSVSRLTLRASAGRAILLFLEHYISPSQSVSCERALHIIITGRGWYRPPSCRSSLRSFMTRL